MRCFDRLGLPISLDVFIYVGGLVGSSQLYPEPQTSKKEPRESMRGDLQGAPTSHQYLEVRRIYWGLPVNATHLGLQDRYGRDLRVTSDQSLSGRADRVKRSSNVGESPRVIAPKLLSCLNKSQLASKKSHKLQSMY